MSSNQPKAMDSSNCLNSCKKANRDRARSITDSMAAGSSTSIASSSSSGSGRKGAADTIILDIGHYSPSSPSTTTRIGDLPTRLSGWFSHAFSSPSTDLPSSPNHPSSPPQLPHPTHPPQKQKAPPPLLAIYSTAMLSLFGVLIRFPTDGCIYLSEVFATSTPTVDRKATKGNVGVGRTCGVGACWD
ncbi:hypothetical protein PILCRDRAFT_14631 [Piloderma croceum F 1598]|uniref:Uncharacterized protein n=1 Tax=Piloderma croceum (strain F 1598) TaxID=765440 RepID=A0A0C3F2Q9_PILCF|nr:hypothetical protein PILCRDRAFT_14631 [Piloderma croceum F 1598]